MPAPERGSPGSGVFLCGPLPFPWAPRCGILEKTPKEDDTLWKSAPPPLADLAAVTALEAACFPGGGRRGASFQARLPPSPDSFWLLVEGGRVLAMVNGMVTQQPDLTDAMYDDASLHDPAGPWQMIFGVATHPDCRCRGYAGTLLRHAIQETRPGERQGWCSPARRSWSPTTPGSALSARGASASQHGGRPGTKCACGCDPPPACCTLLTGLPVSGIIPNNVSDFRSVTWL